MCYSVGWRLSAVSFKWWWRALEMSMHSVCACVRSRSATRPKQVGRNESRGVGHVCVCDDRGRCKHPHLSMRRLGLRTLSQRHSTSAGERWWLGLVCGVCERWWKELAVNLQCLGMRRFLHRHWNPAGGGCEKQSTLSLFKHTPVGCSGSMLMGNLGQQYCTHSSHNRLCTLSTPQIVSLSFCFFPCVFSSSSSLTLPPLDLHLPPPRSPVPAVP